MTATVTKDARDFHRQDLKLVRERRDSLAQSSHVRQAMTDDLLNQLHQKIEGTADVADLNYSYWPCIFGFLTRATDEAITDLDGDLDLVISHTAPSRASAVTRFLQTRDTDHDSRWYGGLFEVFAKATLFRLGQDVEFDVPLPNKRDHDIAATICGRRIHFECTVITNDDESRDVWDRFLVDKKHDARRTLIRPGPYDPPNAKGPSPYYMPLRLYGKIYDKVAKNLDPTKSQCVDGEPNIILVCFAGPGVDTDHPGVGWAFEELFADLPKMPRTGVPEGLTDISLQAWADFTANSLIAANKMNVDWYCDNSNKVLAAPRRLGGAVLFDGATFARGRLNYNAHDECVVSHAEMAELERIMSQPCRYWL